MSERLTHVQAVSHWLHQAARHEPYFLALDGHSAAGKSTLSRALMAGLERCQVIQGDDFYRVMDAAARMALTPAEGYARYFDWQRLEAQVLRPLRAGQTARYQAYDWETNALGAWQTARPEGVLVVEGVYSARPELAGYYDAVVYVEAPPAARWQRQRERGDAGEWIERWEAAEADYLRTSGLRERADVVYAASAPHRPNS